MSVKGTSKSLGNKHELDKFYTKEDVVDQCLSYIDFDKHDCIIEPSAGSGAFSNKINGIHAFDLLPEDLNIIQADWLKLDKTQFNKFNNILVIGNPPFGTSGSLAYSFIVESMKFSNTVAFILPKGFKKRINEKQNSIKFFINRRN